MKKATIIGVIAFVIIIAFLSFFIFKKDNSELSIETDAEILEITDTGNGYGTDIEAVIKLKVIVDEPFEVSVTEVIVQEDIEKYEPGNTVRIKYTPKDKTQATILYVN